MSRTLLKKALDTQERGDFLTALNLENEALLEFQKNKDYSGMAEITVLRAKTLKHLFQSTTDIAYLIVARSEAQAAVEIAEKSEVKGAAVIPNFVVAQLYEALNEIPQAIEAYKKALEDQPNATEETHQRQSVHADMLGHYAHCLYKAKDPSALNIALQALSKLESTTDANQYERNVWLSGAHMRIAQMYADSDKSKAQAHLQKAREIIEADESLILRKKQLQKLRKDLAV